MHVEGRPLLSRNLQQHVPTLQGGVGDTAGSGMMGGDSLGLVWHFWVLHRDQRQAPGRGL